MGEWVEWKGGECPVASGTNVKLRFRDGWATAKASPSKEVWEHRGDKNDIIAYRVIEPEQPSKRRSQVYDPITGDVTEQAHAMSHPSQQTDSWKISNSSQRQHVSDAAWEALNNAYNYGSIGMSRESVDRDYARIDLIVLTVAEHEELLRYVKNVSDYRKAADDALAEAEKHYAEVKRLSAELAARTQAWEAEEWKLRGELSEARADVAELEAEQERDAKEYEQAAKFIEAMGLVSTIHPTMPIDVLDPMGMARQIVDYVERLRKGVMPNADDRSESVGNHESERGRNAVAGDASAKTRDCLDYSGNGKVSVPVADIISSPNVQRQVEAVERLRKGREDGVEDSALVSEQDRPARPDAGPNAGGRAGDDCGCDCARRSLNAVRERIPLAVADTLNPRLGIPQPDGEPVTPMSARKAYRWGMM